MLLYLKCLRCFSNRFGQNGGFARLRERFEAIMEGLKPDLTASIISIEKVTTDTTEKESEEEKSETVTAETIECVPVIAENVDVSVA